MPNKSGMKIDFIQIEWETGAKLVKVENGTNKQSRIHFRLREFIQIGHENLLLNASHQAHAELSSCHRQCST